MNPVPIGFFGAGALDTPASPGVGAIVLAGRAPSIYSSTVVSPGSGAITLAGKTPNGLLGTLLSPAAGAVALTGLTPSATVTAPASAWDPASVSALNGESLSNANKTFSLNNSSNSLALGTSGYSTNAGLDRYFEITVDSDSGVNTQALTIGIGDSSAAPSIGGDSHSFGYYGGFAFGAGQKKAAGSFSAYGAQYTAGDVIGVRLNGTALTFYKNGASQGLAFTLTANATVWLPCAGSQNSNAVASLTLNTGGSAFVSLPSGSTAWG